MNHSLVGFVARDRRDRLRIKRPRRAMTIIELLAVMVVIGALSALVVPRYHDFLEKARVARAIGDIRSLSTDLESLDSLPATLAGIGRAGMLDPWGNPYVYYRFPPSVGGAPPAGARVDRFNIPVNSTYDLYSIGRDGVSALPFTSTASLDDVARAGDGGFIGLAGKY
jgi:general secretion pathway protein G